MDKIFLIKKYTSSCGFWQNLIRKNKIVDLSVNAVINSYDGFEGDLIRSFSMEETLYSEEGSLLLGIIPAESSTPDIIHKLFVKIGYDFGVFEKDKTIYSSVFNEILFGNIASLINFQHKLNDHLIFKSSEMAQEYATLHHDLFIAGEDVEYDEDMKIFEIWRHL